MTFSLDIPEDVGGNSESFPCHWMFILGAIICTDLPTRLTFPSWAFQYCSNEHEYTNERNYGHFKARKTRLMEAA